MRGLHIFMVQGWDRWIGQVGSYIVSVKYLPGSWPCMNMAAFHKDYFYHFSISLSRCCLWNHIAQFWSILGNFLWFFNLISIQNPIWAELEDLGETDHEIVIFSKPLNWVFGKTLKYRIKKLNTWPGQLKHALLTFRTPLAPTKSSFPPFEPFFQISEKTFGPKIHI